MGKTKSTKYYAVAVGRNTGIYEDWNSCEQQVKGFPKARFKRFSTHEQAQAFLVDNNIKHGHFLPSNNNNNNNNNAQSTKTTTTTTHNFSPSLQRQSDNNDDKNGIGVKPTTTDTRYCTSLRTSGLGYYGYNDDTQGDVKPTTTDTRYGTSLRTSRFSYYGNNDDTQGDVKPTAPPATNEVRYCTSLRTSRFGYYGNNNDTEEDAVNDVVSSLKKRKFEEETSPNNNNEPQRCCTIRVYFDGGSRGNPGIAGAGAEVIVMLKHTTAPASNPYRQRPPSTYNNNMQQHKKIHLRKYLGNNATNNQAEYHGLILGLQRTRAEILELVQSEPTRNICWIFQLQVYGDSELVLYQMDGTYKCRNPLLQALLQQAKACIESMKRIMNIQLNVTYEHIPRKDNAKADALANEAMDWQHGSETVFYSDGTLSNRPLSS